MKMTLTDSEIRSLWSFLEVMCADMEKPLAVNEAASRMRDLINLENLPEPTQLGEVVTSPSDKNIQFIRVVPFEADAFGQNWLRVGNTNLNYRFSWNDIKKEIVE